MTVSRGHRPYHLETLCAIHKGTRSGKNRLPFVNWVISIQDIYFQKLSPNIKMSNFFQSKDYNLTMKEILQE